VILLKRFWLFSALIAAFLIPISGCAAQYHAAPIKADPTPSMVSSAQLASSEEGKSSSKAAFRAENSPGKAGTPKELILVNAANKIPDDYKLNLTTSFGVRMDQIISAAYTEMWKSALEAGITLWISSGYRSEEEQRLLFSDEVRTHMEKGLTRQQAEKEAEKSVARPGYSEHATGLTLDLNGVKEDFDQTKAFAWLSQHAQEYGFILRYPKDKQNITKVRFEPWHYRYVGKESARAMKSDNLCLEEYLG
jgi:D-alanyl-D-alanine carboxypeptidase